MTLEDPDFFGFAHEIFCQFAQKKPETVNLIFSRNLKYPIIKHLLDASFVMPLPKFKNGRFYFEGIEFEDTPEQRHVLWSLFLASIYHLAGHAAVSRYEIYERWTKNKTTEICLKIINFIEDALVEKFTTSTYPQIMRNILEIKSNVNDLEKESSNQNKGITFTLPGACYAKNKDILSEILSDLNKIGNDSERIEQILTIAEKLYKNRHLLPQTIFPFCEHENDANAVPYVRNTMVPHLDEEFKEIISKLDELWVANEQKRIRMLRQYCKYMKGLQFDNVVLAEENYHEFAQTKENILPTVRRIRQQIRMVVNVTDSPRTDKVGSIDMQMAIQAIASKGKTIEVYETDEDRRGEEAWVILIDKSASMRLRFDHIREFAICVAEAANELTGRHDAWALYSFDNNFQIIKDFKERYSHQVQGRLGGLKNSGLSLLPDAIELSYRILVSDPREKKFLFVITDGHPSGYERINEQFSKIAKKVEVSGIILVAIGVSKATSKKFRNSVRGTELKQLVAKFITAYRTASSDM